MPCASRSEFSSQRVPPCWCSTFGAGSGFEKTHQSNDQRRQQQLAPQRPARPFGQHQGGHPGGASCPPPHRRACSKPLAQLTSPSRASTLSMPQENSGASAALPAAQSRPGQAQAQHPEVGWPAIRQPAGNLRPRAAAVPALGQAPAILAGQQRGQLGGKISNAAARVKPVSTGDVTNSQQPAHARQPQQHLHGPR